MQKNVKNDIYWPLSPQKVTKMTKMEIFQNNVFKTTQEVQHSKNKPALQWFVEREFKKVKDMRD